MARHVDPQKQKLLEQLLGLQQTDRMAEPRREVLTSGQPRILSNINDDVLAQVVRDPAHREIIRKVAPRSSIAVPLVLRGRTIGVLQVAVGESRRPLRSEDVPVVAEIAHVATLAIENARRYEASKRREAAERFLAEVGATLVASSLDRRETLETIGRLLVRDLADWCGGRSSTAIQPKPRHVKRWSE